MASEVGEVREGGGSTAPDGEVVLGVTMGRDELSMVG